MENRPSVPGGSSRTLGGMTHTEDAFTPPDPRTARRLRTHQALIRLTERHATGEHRTRWEHDRMPMPSLDALRRVADLAAGGAPPNRTPRPWTVTTSPRH